MADKTTAALWFVKNVLHGKFQELAKSRSFSISRLNETITNSSKYPSPASPSIKCGFCSISFDSRCKPLYCPRCVKWFHKTNCHKTHRCNLDPLPPTTGPSTAISLPVPSIQTSTAVSCSPIPTMSSSSTGAATVSTTLLTTSSATTISVNSSSSFVSPLTSQISTSSSTLNPSAQQFRSSVQPPFPAPTPATTRKPRQTQILNNFTPERAELESLKIQLGYAHTKIVDIQSKNQDLEETILIYSQKLKLLENTRKDFLHEKYFSPPSDATSTSPDCPCQIKAHISKNSMNMKKLELKLVQELEKITQRLDNICSQPHQPHSHAQSTNEEPPSNQIPPKKSSSPKHDSQVQHGQDALADTISLFTFEESGSNHDQEPAQTTSNTIHDSSSSDHESSFSFSDSFVPPVVSPELPLN